MPELWTPRTDQLETVIGTLGSWQREEAPVQLHPGDLGWSWRFGADAVARACRVWTSHDEVVAIGFLDGPDVLRLTVAPEVWDDDEVAGRIVGDVGDPSRGLLPAGTVSVESPNGSRVQALLDAAGWRTGDSWTPLRRLLDEAVRVSDVPVDVVGPGQVADFTAVHRSAWGSATFTEQRWRAMASGPLFADARCLLVRDGHGVPVAGITVWSAGRGRPGLIEPLGTHAEHRGQGHGRAACLAAAAELQRLGASSALVCTETARGAAVATYRASGFTSLPVRLDRTRD